MASAGVIVATTLATVLGLFLLYLVVGSLVRYRMGMRRWPEMLPHFRVWSALLAYVGHRSLWLLTCGKHTIPRGQSVLSALPSKPRPVRDVLFEPLPSDLDDFDEDAAMQPARVVVVY